MDNYSLYIHIIMTIPCILVRLFDLHILFGRLRACPKLASGQSIARPLPCKLFLTQIFDLTWLNQSFV